MPPNATVMSHRPTDQQSRSEDANACNAGSHPTPINILPPEILTEVFLILVNKGIISQAPYELEQDRRTRLFRLLVISSVCRSWRALALSCPLLWSEVHIRKNVPQFTELMLERAADAPLSILQMTPPSPTELAVLQRVLGQGHRIRSVVISYLFRGPFDFFGLFPGWLAGRSAPSLERFSLLVPPTVHRRSHSIPERFLEGGAPSLKELTLHGVNIFQPSTASVLSSWGANLTHLTLSLHPGENARSNLVLFYAAIAHQAPSLEHLSLTNFLPRPSLDSDPPYASEPLEFPNLYFLKISDYPRNCASFFRRIHVPNVHCPRIRLYRHPGIIDAYNSILSHLHASWMGAPSSSRMGGYQKLVMDHGDDPHPPSLSQVRVYPVSSAPGSTPMLELDVDIQDVFTLEDFLPSAVRHLDLRPLTWLSLGGWWTERITEDEWVSWFGRLPHLEHIFLYDNGDVAPLAMALGPGDGKPIQVLASTSLRRTHAFPALLVLQLRHIDFRRDFDENSDPLDSIALLVVAWGGGYRGGCPNLTLKVSRCANFTRAGVALLRERIPAMMVEWDGMVPVLREGGSGVASMDVLQRLLYEEEIEADSD